MKRITPMISAIIVGSLAAPAFAASMSMDDIKIRLQAQANSQKIEPASVRTDENDEPLSMSGYMAVPSHARIMLDVQFKVGSAVVTKQGGKQIKALCNAMTAMPSMPSLQLIGHTDRSGRAEKNLEVSQDRAAAVKDYIVTECELPGGLILTSGEGEAFAPTTGKANNADDRRIEVQLIGMSTAEPLDAEEEKTPAADG
jgi:outer membrane protein OmpA-like peptidoglycan-associated protein